MFEYHPRPHFTNRFFFLMIRRPPRSTLFPYTRSSDLSATLRPTKGRRPPVGRGDPERTRNPLDTERSEEHTSELQSQSNLVCRLLLEKKKNETNELPRPDKNQQNQVHDSRYRHILHSL